MLTSDAVRPLAGPSLELTSLSTYRTKHKKDMISKRRFAVLRPRD